MTQTLIQKDQNGKYMKKNILKNEFIAFILIMAAEIFTA